MYARTHKENIYIKKRTDKIKSNKIKQKKETVMYILLIFSYFEVTNSNEKFDSIERTEEIFCV